MKKSLYYIILLFVMPIISKAQSISTSPYSLFGVGSTYTSDFGGIPGLGGSGMALPSDSFINNLNPASLGFMNQNHFLFDVGGKSIFSTYESNAVKESRNTMQFTHLAFAFPVSKKAAVSVALQPYSSASYKISDLSLPILDSNSYYNLDVARSGGLNDVDVSFGYKVTPKLALGATGTFLFGSTIENREYTIATSISTIDKESFYNGIRGSVGVQYKIDSTFTIAGTFKLPAKIRASKIQSVSSQNTTGSIVVETDVNSDTDDYYLPSEIGVGLSKTFNHKLTMTFDYERSLWKDSKQSELYGDFVNQDRLALGFSYKKGTRSYNYFDQIKYAAGINYNSGFLELNGSRVDDRSLSLGISLPLENNFSAVNLSYSYGQKGKIGDGLIKENYHTISLNLSLDGIWFLRRKID